MNIERKSASIPVLGVPIYNGQRHLLKLIESIDHPVEKLVIVINNDNISYGGFSRPLSALVPNGIVSEVSIHRHPNIGVAGAWNEVIKCHRAKWWMMVNHDIEFSPGALNAFAKQMQVDDSVAAVIADGVHNMACFALNEQCVDQVGLFDENFWPAYCEDTDYVRRATLAGIKYTHLQELNLAHKRSSTVDDMSTIERAWVHRCHEMNKEYFIAKWGGWGQQAQYKTPFDRAESRIFDCPYIPSLRWIRRMVSP